MAEPRLSGPMKWWGWGDPATARRASAARRSTSCAPSSACSGDRDRRRRLDDVRLADTALTEKPQARLADAVGEEWVRDDRSSRVTHAAGKGYPDLVRLRAGDATRRPTRSSTRPTPSEVRAVLDACAAERRRGRPVRRRHERRRRRRAAARRHRRGRSRSTSAGIDHARRRRQALADRRRSARACAARRSRQALATHGLTLGHFPQSFEYATVGGWVATRSAGQASTGYGSIEKLVVRPALRRRRAARSTCRRCRRPPPARACASSWSARRALLGRDHRGDAQGAARAGGAAVRGLDVPRLRGGRRGVPGARAGGTSCPTSRGCRTRTRRGCRWRSRGDGSLSGAPAAATFGARGYEGGCIAIARLRGRARPASRAAPRARGGSCARGGRPVARRRARPRLGARAATTAPYLRDALLDHGVMAETLETAHEWSRLMDLYGAVRGAIASALEARGTPGLVMCHISHLYPSGASLYFTFLARAGARRGARAVARGEGRPRATRSRASGGHDHAPPRDRPRPRAVDAARGRRARPRGARSRSRGASTRPAS